MPSPKGRILCTEDDPDSRDLLVYILENEGYLVTVTGNSAHALAIAKRDFFDLIVILKNRKLRLDRGTQGWCEAFSLTS